MAVSVGSLAGGITVAVILVVLATLTLDTGTTLKSAAFTYTNVTGQDAVAVGSKLVPVIVMS